MAIDTRDINDEFLFEARLNRNVHKFKGYITSHYTTVTGADVIALKIGNAVVPKSARDLAELYHQISSHDVSDTDF